MKNRPFMKSLHGKLTMQTLVIGLLPVIVVGAIAYQSLSQLTTTADERLSQSRAALARDVVGANLTSTASRVSQQIDVFMRERIADVVVWASAPNVVAAARGADSEHRRRDLASLSIAAVEAQFSTEKSLHLYTETDAYLKQQIAASPHFGEIFFTDTNGFNVSLTNPTSDFVQRDEGWWKQTWQNGVHVGQVEYDESAGIWSVDISVRIDDATTGNRLGVMKSVLGVSLIQEVASARAAEINGGLVSVLTDDGLLLAETATQHAQDRIMNAEVNLRASADPAMRTVFEGEAAGYVLGEERVLGFARLAGNEFYRDIAARFDGFNWVVAVQQPTVIAFAPIEGLAVVQEGLAMSKRNIAVALVIAVFVVGLASMLLAHFMSRTITQPLFMLRDLADRVSRGDTSKTIAVKSDDEIKDLADAFERMRKSIAIAMRRIRETNKVRSATG